MKLIAIEEIDHHGIKRVGAEFEVNDQMGKQLIEKKLCIEYSAKAAKTFQDSKLEKLSESVVQNSPDSGTGNEQIPLEPGGDKKGK